MEGWQDWARLSEGGGGRGEREDSESKRDKRMSWGTTREGGDDGSVRIETGDAGACVQMCYTLFLLIAAGMYTVGSNSTAKVPDRAVAGDCSPFFFF